MTTLSHRDMLEKLRPTIDHKRAGDDSLTEGFMDTAATHYLGLIAERLTELTDAVRALHPHQPAPPATAPAAGPLAAAQVATLVDELHTALDPVTPMILVSQDRRDTYANAVETVIARYGDMLGH